MITRVEDCFIKKCPACSQLLRKATLQEEHLCDCGYEWEAMLNGIKATGDISKIEI